MSFDILLGFQRSGAVILWGLVFQSILPLVDGLSKTSIFQMSGLKAISILLLPCLRSLSPSDDSELELCSGVVRSVLLSKVVKNEEGGCAFSIFCLCSEEWLSFLPSSYCGGDRPQTIDFSSDAFDDNYMLIGYRLMGFSSFSRSPSPISLLLESLMSSTRYCACAGYLCTFSTGAFMIAFEWKKQSKHFTGKVSKTSHSIIYVKNYHHRTDKGAFCSCVCGLKA